MSETSLHSHWLIVLACLLLMAALYGLFRWQRHRVVAQMVERHEERLKERERIARELHDTLLQDVQALVLNLGVFQESLTKEGFASEGCRSISNAANAVLQAARNGVSGLRDEGGCIDLCDELTEQAQKLATLYPARFECRVSGTPVPILSWAKEEALASMREAMLNAFRHAGAGVIVLEIKYESHQLELSVRDNGVGPDPAVLAIGRKDGHWGLVGMKERAKRLCAGFEIVAPVGGGTLVRLAIPSKVAFDRSARKARGSVNSAR